MITDLIKTLKTVRKNYRKLFSTKNRNSLWMSWPYLVVYYFVARQIIGLQYGLIYFFILFLLVARVRFITISLIFFTISAIVYILGQQQEANNYMSFVFGFLLLSIAIEINNILVKKKNA